MTQDRTIPRPKGGHLFWLVVATTALALLALLMPSEAE